MFFKRICFFLIVSLLLFFEIATAVTPSPRKKDLRFRALGGAYTALTQHNLMGYYNPAAFAFNQPFIDPRKAELYEDYAVKKRRSRHTAFSIFDYDFSYTRSFYNNRNDLKTFLKSSGVINSNPFKGNKIVGNSLRLVGLDGIFNFTGIQDVSSDTNALIEISERLKNVSFKIDNNITVFPLEMTTKHFGYGLDVLNSTEMKFDLTFDELTNTSVKQYPDLNIVNEINLYTAFGFKIKHAPQWAIGFSPKIFNRLEIKVSVPSEFEDVQSSFTSLPTDYLKRISQQTSSLIDDLIRIGNGYGIDAGVMYNPFKGFFLGVAVQDLITIISWGKDEPLEIVPITFDIGVAYQVQFDLFGLFSNPTFSFSVSDSINRYNLPFAQHIHTGISFHTFFNEIEFLAGIDRGTLGLGFSKTFNLSFISKIPFVKVFFPTRTGPPVFWPKSWDKAGMLEFYRRNLLMWTLGWVMYGLSKVDFIVEGGYYGIKILNSLDTDQQEEAALNLRMGFHF